MLSHLSKSVFAIFAVLIALTVPAAATSLSISAVTGPTSSDAATALLNVIVGAGVQVTGTPTYKGNLIGQAGIFSGGADTIGFANGIILTSGSATDIAGRGPKGIESLGGQQVGTNYDSWSHNLLPLSGDVDLNTLVPGKSTFDANVIQFTFTVTEPGSLHVKYVFASEEYINYVGREFNDVFGFFLDGVNIAKLNNAIVSVNTINPSANSAFYRNNVPNTNGIPDLNLNIKPDGLTTVLTTTAVDLAVGQHTMKLAIADVQDHILDSAVFIEAASFSTAEQPIPEPSTIILVGIGLVAFGLKHRTR